MNYNFKKKSQTVWFLSYQISNGFSGVVFTVNYKHFKEVREQS